MSERPTPYDGSEPVIYATGRAIAASESLRGQPLNLCARCASGQVMRRVTPAGTQAEEVVFCRQLGRRMPPDIAECSAFWDKKRMTLDEMHGMALLVDPRKGVDDRSYR